MPAHAEGGIDVRGLDIMLHGLKTGAAGVAPELRQRLRNAGEGIVAPVARKYAPVGVRSARYRFSGPSLNESIKAGATRAGANVYSTSIYGGVQNYGGRVGRNHATVLRRADVSQYMTRAVTDTHVATVRHVEGTLDWLERELGC